MNRSRLLVLRVVLILTIGVGCQKTSPPETMIFGPGHQDYSKPIQNGYSLYRSSAHEVFVSPETWGENTPRIPSEIIRINHYKTFVIAERQVATVQEKTDYWILNTKEPMVWGGMTKEEMNNKMDSLQIPTSIQLLAVDVY